MSGGVDAGDYEIDSVHAHVDYAQDREDCAQGCAQGCEKLGAVVHDYEIADQDCEMGAADQECEIGDQWSFATV